MEAETQDLSHSSHLEQEGEQQRDRAQRNSGLKLAEVEMEGLGMAEAVVAEDLDQSTAPLRDGGHEVVIDAAAMADVQALGPGTASSAAPVWGWEHGVEVE